MQELASSTSSFSRRDMQGRILSRATPSHPRLYAVVVNDCPRVLVISYQEIAAGAVGEPRVEGVDEVAHVDGGFDPRSRALGLFVSGDRSIALSAHTSGDERPAKTTRELLGFPISHMLEFTPEAKAEREAFGARLSEEVGVPLAMAISALEAFGDDHARARQWLLTQQVPSVPF